MDSYFFSSGAASSAMTDTQSATPTTGQTVTLNDNSLDGTCYVNPAGALLALTVTLPSEANSRIGQVRDIFITKAITTLTINGATTILNTVTAAIANNWITVKKVAANTLVVRVS